MQNGCFCKLDDVVVPFDLCYNQKRLHVINSTDGSSSSSSVKLHINSPPKNTSQNIFMLFSHPAYFSCICWCFTLDTRNSCRQHSFSSPFKMDTLALHHIYLHNPHTDLTKATTKLNWNVTERYGEHRHTRNKLAFMFNMCICE